MSEFTLDGIMRAIQAHIDDEAEQNETVMDFVFAAHTSAFESDDPNVHSYWFYACPKPQPNHVTLGLIEMLDQWAHSGGIEPD